MQKTIHNLARLTLPFVLVLGILQIASSRLHWLGDSTELSFTLASKLDLPFLAVALLYASSKLSLALHDIFDENSQLPFIVCLSISAVLFSIALLLNFSAADLYG